MPILRVKPGCQQLWLVALRSPGCTCRSADCDWLDTNNDAQMALMIKRKFERGIVTIQMPRIGARTRKLVVVRLGSLSILGSGSAKLTSAAPGEDRVGGRRRNANVRLLGPDVRYSSPISDKCAATKSTFIRSPRLQAVASNWAR
jgi:hypothetical protein